MTADDGRPLKAAAGLAIAVTAGVIDCRDWGTRAGSSSPHRAADGRPISKLPAGFSALELHAPRVTIVWFHPMAWNSVSSPWLLTCV